MRKYFKSTFLWFAILLAGCLDPYNPPAINSEEKYLVVDGFINSTGTTTFLLSHTRNIGDTANNKINNAAVYIEAKGGGINELSNVGNGEYKIDHLFLNPSDQYRLRIILNNKKEYHSEFVSVRETPDIDSVTWSRTDDGIQILVNTHDPQGRTRYYSYEYDETWKFHSAYYSGLMLNSEGAIVYRPPNMQIYYCYQFNKSKTINVATSEHLSEDIIYKFPLTSLTTKNSNKLSVKYSILVKQMAITKEAFEYWSNLKKVSENLGSLFDPQPINFRGNIKSVSNEEEIVLGFVSIGSKKEKRIFITREESGFLRVFTGYEQCELDTIPSKTRQSMIPGELPVTEITGPTGGSLLLVGSFGCIDCTVRGTTQVPDFWEQ